MRFRLHRGGLADSLSTTRDIRDLRELSEALAVDASVLSFDPMGDDKRIGWTDVHMVLKDGLPVGYIEGRPT